MQNSISHLFKNVNFNNLLNVFCAAKRKRQNKKNVTKSKEKVCNKMTRTRELLNLEQYYLVQPTHHAVLHKMTPDNTIKSKKLISCFCLNSAYRLLYKLPNSNMVTQK